MGRNEIGSCGEQLNRPMSLIVYEDFLSLSLFLSVVVSRDGQATSQQDPNNFIIKLA